MVAVSRDMRILDEVVAGHHILIHEANSLNRQRNCTVLGVELCDGTWSEPKGGRVKSLWSCVMP